MNKKRREEEKEGGEKEKERDTGTGAPKKTFTNVQRSSFLSKYSAY